MKSKLSDQAAFDWHQALTNGSQILLGKMQINITLCLNFLQIFGTSMQDGLNFTILLSSIM